MLTKSPVPYDVCTGVPISRLLTVGSTPVQHSVLNVKALVGAFNQEKALVGAFFVIVQLHRWIVSQHQSSVQSTQAAGTIGPGGPLELVSMNGNKTQYTIIESFLGQIIITNLSSVSSRMVNKIILLLHLNIHNDAHATNVIRMK